jgi:hypothetical protein
VGGHKYTTTSWWKRLVSEYTGLNFLEIEKLNYLTYLTWRRDAFIHKMNQTEKGQEYLDNAWRMEQTEPDRAALRKQLRKEETDGE